MARPLLADSTHARSLKSWVPSANVPGTDFPIQNLPLGRFRPRVEAGEEPGPWRFGVAIGDQVLDLKLAATLCPWADEIYPLIDPLAAGDLPAFMALHRSGWKTFRAALSAALAEGSDQGPFLEMCLLPRTEAQMAMPCAVGNYTDFYVGIHHARAVGALFRPDNPLLPNYQWVPIGYHGRASSVRLGGSFKRPRGQTRAADATAPVFGPSRRLDYELELGIWVGVDNALGEPVPMADAEDHIFGVSLLNDWSARDLQGWEYQPLGPFLSKNFFTSVSPWLVSLEALAPFRRPFARPEGEPAPLPHLSSDFNRQYGQIDITLQAWLQTRRMQLAAMPPVQLSQSNLLDAYWTPAQLIAHHTSNGCNLQRGDLLGSGTISGPGPGQGGSLLELSSGGKQPLQLPSGEKRTFLEDGDTVILKAFCEARGAVRIGLGQLAGTVQA
ncbi:MAG TPA: fumarylacetoacetase [Rubrivivax sp.]|nr:fumarylacetoacetase [Rubrivivax sp.]